MSDEPKPRSPGCLTRIFTLILFFASIGLAVALFYAVRPQDLSDIKGYRGAISPNQRDLKVALANAVERGYPLAISEADLNVWLRQSLSLKQGGVFGEKVELDGVAVRLEKGRAEVIFERHVFGKPFTVSMYLRIEQTETPEGTATLLHRDDGPYFRDFPMLKKGGRIGSLEVPQGLLLLVMPSYQELAAKFSEEIHLGFERMVRVKIEEEELTLDSRDNSMPGGISPATF